MPNCSMDRKGSFDLGFAATLENIEASLRRGRGSLARQQLTQLARHPLSRPHLSAVAALACRAGLPGLGAKLLNPIVRSPSSAATEIERAEYAQCLTKLGAIDEALTLLKGLTCPQALLYEAGAHIARWNYAVAIPLLKAYIMRDLTPYRRLVGYLNLASALLFERRYRDADPILSHVLYETGNHGFRRLRAHALTLAAHHRLTRREPGQAKRFLEEAAKLLDGEDSHETFFVRKWKMITALIESRGKGRSREAIARFREEAFARRQWEAARDCDWFESRTLGDEDGLVHVYVGTPYESYRRRILGETDIRSLLPESYRWRLAAGPRECVVDAVNGRGGTGGKELPERGLVLRLLRCLASDFYRPFRLASLYALLFPGEYFNPTVSPSRVHQAMKLLRAWFDACAIPLELRQKDGFYSLAAQGPVSLLVPVQKLEPIEQLRRAFPGMPFSAGEASRVLGLSPRTTLRLLTEARAQGDLAKLGATKAARYHFNNTG